MTTKRLPNSRQFADIRKVPGTGRILTMFGLVFFSGCSVILAPESWFEDEEISRGVSHRTGESPGGAGQGGFAEFTGIFAKTVRTDPGPVHLLGLEFAASESGSVTMGPENSSQLFLYTETVGYEYHALSPIGPLHLGVGATGEIGFGGNEYFGYDPDTFADESADGILAFSAGFYGEIGVRLPTKNGNGIELFVRLHTVMIPFGGDDGDPNDAALSDSSIMFGISFY